MCERSAFSAATEKGNALILALCILNLISVVSIYLSVQLAHLAALKNEDTSLEVLKIKAIRRIKDEYYHQKCEDFSLEEDNCYVDVSYDENQCILYFYGQYSFQMILEYDDVYLCIGAVEYVYDQ